MDRGAWRAIVNGVAKESDMTEQLTHTHTTQRLGAGRVQRAQSLQEMSPGHARCPLHTSWAGTGVSFYPSSSHRRCPSALQNRQSASSFFFKLFFLGV